MSIVAWICLGLVGGTLVGWVSGARGRDLLGSVVASVLGAILGGFMASVLLGIDISGVDLTTVLVAAVGALILVALQRSLPAIQVYE